MKTRFDKAVMKLYKAFHEGTLNPFNCRACAVGSLVGHGGWRGYGFFELSIGSFNRDTFNQNNYPLNSDYTPKELQEIEFRFLYIWNGKTQLSRDKDLQFKGLCEVVKYLAELDGVENPMEIMHLFKNKELVL